MDFYKMARGSEGQEAEEGEETILSSGNTSSLVASFRLSIMFLFYLIPVSFELTERIKTVRGQDDVYAAGEVSHTVLCLTPYHCSLNSDELTRSQVKGYGGEKLHFLKDVRRVCSTSNNYLKGSSRQMEEVCSAHSKGRRVTVAASWINRHQYQEACRY
jgi:hypothetical protein